MKIAYVNVARDGTGYSVASIKAMRACEQAGMDVVSRPVSLSPMKGGDMYLPVIHLEQKDAQGVSAIVQHILPNFFERKDGVKNIGYFHWETNHFKHSGWAVACNMMDEIWCPSIQQKQAAIDSGVNVPIKIIPCCIDCTQYERSVEPMQLMNDKKRCVFYTVGEYNRRKNFISLVRAYYNAFRKHDNVALVIKTNVPGAKPNEGLEQVIQAINGVKEQSRLSYGADMYPPVILKTNFMPLNEIHSLHAAGDVFVTSTRGEAGCLPAMEAMKFGNPVIASNWGNLPELLYGQAAEYFDSETQEFKHPGSIKTGWLTPGQLVPCFGMHPSSGPKYLGDELWFDVNIPALSRQLRKAYHMWTEDTLKTKGQEAEKRIQDFDLSKIGELMKANLEAL
jgi:glycosyltransferase involved in cell wall biosynthesis